MQRKGGARDAPGLSLSSGSVLTLDLDLIMDIESGVSSEEELFDQFPAYLFFFDQRLIDLMVGGLLCVFREGGITTRQA